MRQYGCDPISYLNTRVRRPTRVPRTPTLMVLDAISLELGRLVIPTFLNDGCVFSGSPAIQGDQTSSTASPTL